MRRIFCFIVMVVFVTGCVKHIVNQTINIHQGLYLPKFDVGRYEPLKGKMISFNSIEIEAKNVANFYIYSQDKKTGYGFYGMVSSKVASRIISQMSGSFLATAVALDAMSEEQRQPVATFFWYALEKSLRHAGLFVSETGPLKNIPEMVLTFTSLTNSEAVFRLKMTKDQVFLFEKELTVFHQMSPTTDTDELVRRSYLFIDKIAEKILSDSDFIKAFDSDTVPKILEAQAQLQKAREQQRLQANPGQALAYQTPVEPVTPGIMVLPDGQKILDLNGAWNMENVYYGSGAFGSSGILVPAEVIIKQKERYFEIILKQDSFHANKGTMMMKGQILSEGIRIIDAARANWLKMKCQADENRNKMVCDDGTSQRLTYLRR